MSGTGPSYDRSNATLVVEHIPDDKMDEAVIREFFGEFGTVASVELTRPKHLALVKFERWDMAKKAYDSPTPIFDNRFIKVFWLKSSNTDQNGVGTKPVEPVDEPIKLADEMEIDMEGFKRKQEEAQKVHEAKRAKKKANEDAAKELERRKEELLKMQLEEKRKLEEKLAKKRAGTSASPPLTVSAGSPSSAPEAAAAGSVKPKDDAATTAALKAQLQALEEEARALGIENHAGDDAFDLSGFRGRGRGRGRFVPRGARGGFYPRGRGNYVPPYTPYGGRGAFIAARGRGGTLKLDNRTRKVTVSAVDLRGAKDEEFRHYLMVSVCVCREWGGGELLTFCHPAVLLTLVGI
jgi:RNA-binding protein 26